MDFSSARQRRIRTLGSVTLIALGAALWSNTSAAIGLILALLCAGLVAAGSLRFIEALQARTWRPVHILAALLLALAGPTLLVWRTATLPLLALTVSLVLLVTGLTRLAIVFSRHSESRWRGLLNAFTGLFSSVLVIFWPRLSLWVLAIAFGGWLMLLGLGILYRTWSETIPPMPAWFSRLTRFGSGLLTTVGLLLVLALGVITAQLHASSGHAVPDDFYLPPASVPGSPGQLLRFEPLRQTVAPQAVSWRILYTTTDHRGEPALSSAVVTVPAEGTGDHPVISWANGTKGVQPRCALSMAANPFDDGPAQAREAMLDAGWAIVATDYPGLGTRGPHHYLVPRAAAAAVLDATRAAEQLPGVNLSKQTVFWGHSQGGHAALSAAALAPSYSPELAVLGTAAMAPASDLPVLAATVADTAVGKVVSSYIATSWNEIYPELGITGQLNNAANHSVQRIAANCFSGREVIGAIAQASQLFEPIFPSSAREGAIGERLRANSAPLQIAGPVFLAQGGSDSLVTPNMQQGWREAACATGTSIHYRQYPGLEHMGLVGNASALHADLVQWTTDLAAGRPMPHNCGS